MKKININVFVMIMTFQLSYPLFGSAPQDICFTNTHAYLNRDIIDSRRLFALPVADRSALEQLNKEHAAYYKIAREKELDLSQMQNEKHAEKIKNILGLIFEWVPLNNARYNRILLGWPETLQDSKDYLKMLALDIKIKKLIE